jgi:hypothetical protein
MPNGRINLDAVAAGIAYLVKADPKAAAVATDAIAKQLSPVQRGQLPREISEAVRDQQRVAQTVSPGLTNAQKELMLDLGQIGLDIVGLVDPTPVSDGLNGIVSLFRGDFLGAGISAVSMIPYIGDAAKLGKLGKWSKTIDRAIDIARAAPNSAMSKALRPAIDKIADGLNAIPNSVLNKLPASAKNQILEMRAKANAFLNGPTATSGAKLVAGTAEHKAARWAEYQQHGGTWTEVRWSKQYDVNMRNVSVGLQREVAYRQALGGVSASKKTPFTLRQVDSYKADTAYMGQLKTGKVNLTQQALLDIKKDAHFVDLGFKVEYILEKGASKPFLKALDEAGINYKIGPQI